MEEELPLLTKPNRVHGLGHSLAEGDEDGARVHVCITGSRGITETRQIGKAHIPSTAEGSVLVRLALAITALVVSIGILGLVRACSLLLHAPLVISPGPSTAAIHRNDLVWDIAVLQRIYPHRLGLDNGLGRTPPLGWNSWNTLACNVDEESVKAAADLIVSLGLKDAGYEYINVDDCWASERAPNGTVVVDPESFPSGMTALADYIHSLGLKFGIYSDAGHRTCAGRPGSWGFEGVDAETYASWGVDYLKYDNCNAEDLPGPRVRYPRMRDALNATGRHIFFSMCEWGFEDPATWAGDVGNSWRTTGDIEPAWSSVIDILYANNKWAEYAGPGGFNDPDMLEVGVPANRYGHGLTAAEERSHFVLWALMKSPLLIGADLRNISDESLGLLKNTEVIVVNQVHHDVENPDCQVWGVPLQGSSAAAALFNAGDKECVVNLKFEIIGYKADAVVDLRDILLHADLGMFRGGYSAVVPPHDVLFVRLDLVKL